MKFKLISGLLGLILVIGFLLPPIIKLKSPSLALVVLIGIALATYEYWETLRKKGD